MKFTRTSRNLIVAVVGAVSSMMTTTGALAQLDINQVIAQLAPEDRPVMPVDTPNAQVELVYTAGRDTNANPVVVWDLTRFNNALYFIRNGVLNRVADGGTVTEEVNFGRRYANSLKVFDEALYFTGIAPQGRWTRSLHRLDTNGVVTSIAGTEDIDEFVIYRDDIYFLKATEFADPSCRNILSPSTATRYEIYRVRADGSSGVVEKTNLDVYACWHRASRLKSTSLGLAFTISRGEPVYTNSLYVLRDPIVDATGPSRTHLYRVFNDPDFDVLTEFEAFDGHMFYADEHLFQDTGGQGIGPFADPGPIVVPAGTFGNTETELYRDRPTEDAVYFNLRQLDAEDLLFARELLAAGNIFANGPYVSSRPRDFVVTSRGLYFTANSEYLNDSTFRRSSVPDIFRIASGTATPEQIPLPFVNEIGASERRVLGEAAGRLWILAKLEGDTFNDADRTLLDVDVHYLENGVAVPLSLAESLTGTPAEDQYRSGFRDLPEWVPIPNGMAFFARDGLGGENLYRVIPTSTSPVQTSEVSTAMTVGGNSYASRPGLEVNNTTGLEYQCTVTNNTTDSLTNVSMRLDRRRLASSANEKNGKRIVVKKCSAALLGVSESLTCSYRSRPRANTWKHDCITKVTNGEGAKVKVRDSAYVTRSR